MSVMTSQEGLYVSGDITGGALFQPVMTSQEGSCTTGQQALSSPASSLRPPYCSWGPRNPELLLGCLPAATRAPGSLAYADEVCHSEELVPSHSSHSLVGAAQACGAYTSLWDVCAT